MRNAILAGLMLVGCTSTKLPPETEIEDGLPRWRTHGDEVRLEVAKRFLEQGDTASTLEIIRQARSQGTASAELDLLQGKALRIDGVISEAERLLRLAAKRMPRDGRPPSELCVLYAEEQEVEKAIDHCQRAAKLDENSPKAWNNLAFLLLSEDRYAEAAEAAQEAVKLDGKAALYRNNLGLTQVARGRVEQGFRTFQSTMARADAACMVGLASARFFGVQDAEPWYRRALEIEPTNDCAYRQLNQENEDEAPGGAAEEAP